MSKAQISTDGGKNWIPLGDPDFKEEFDIDYFESEFTNQGAASKMSFRQGPKVVEVTTIQGFTLEVLRNKLYVQSYEDLGSTISSTLDLRIPMARLIIARNAGGIGIADIRNMAYVVRGFVFDLTKTKLSLPSSNDGQVTVYFNSSYTLRSFSA